MHAILKEVLV